MHCVDKTAVKVTTSFCMLDLAGINIIKALLTNGVSFGPISVVLSMWL